MSKVLKPALALFLLAAAVWYFVNARRAAPLPAPGPTAVLAPGETPAQPRAQPGAPSKLEVGEKSAAPQRAAPEAEAALARVHVRLVDERTHAPVPYFSADLHDGVELLERMESDAQGVLTSRGSFAPGAYQLDLSSERRKADLIQTRAKEAKALPASVPFALALTDERAPPADFAIAVGPSLRFQATWPGGLSPASFSGRLSCADPRKAFDRLFAPVQDDSAPWARFSPLAYLISGGPPFLVRVSSEDGLWFASATFETLESAAPQTLQLSFESRGRIVGRLLDPEGKPVGREWVHAWLPDSSYDDPARRPVSALTNADGTYDLPALAPGHYTLKSDVDGFQPIADELDLPALTRIEHDLHQVRIDPSTLGPIRGRVTSESGRFTGKLTAQVVPKSPPWGAKQTNVEWTGEEGTKTGSFELPGLHPHDYQVRLLSEDLVAIEPNELLVQPSEKWLEFRVKDAGARAPLQIQVVAAEDGAALSDYNLIATIRETGEQAWSGAHKGANEVVIQNAPVGATAELEVVKPGRQSLWQEVIVSEHSEPLVLKLSTGWGREMIVSGPDDAPLEGAKVYLDGELAGTSDAQGRVRPQLAAEPKVCRVEYEDWVLAPGGDVLYDTGGLRLNLQRYRVRMKPGK
ncbi:MAG: carboxypeptidase regulatory-like domain-containing protein [Planctomycetes bacterium]|nr:carboxypeptidase regulatory-like domain-containing protein [Planctomycetota bacterium]